MSWFFLAIIGHLCNGIAFVIDKALLNTALKRSATYAALISILSFAALFATPWVNAWPHGMALVSTIAFGFFFVIALWAFFEALKRGEATRVVPVVGSLIPIFTLMATATFLGERLTFRALLGFAILLLATGLLTSGASRTRLTMKTIGISIVAAVLFAAASAFGKDAFNRGDFAGVFVLSRFVAGITGVLIAIAIPDAGREILSIIHPKKKKATHHSRRVGGWAVFGQVMGGIGFILVFLAIKSGSAAIVNALQAIQYALLVVVAFMLHRRAPKLLGEDLTPHVITVKIIALACTAVGMALVI